MLEDRQTSLWEVGLWASTDEILDNKTLTLLQGSGVETDRLVSLKQFWLAWWKMVDEAAGEIECASTVMTGQSQFYHPPDVMLAENFFGHLRWELHAAPMKSSMYWMVPSPRSLSGSGRAPLFVSMKAERD